jgi:hypothetical protein
MESMPATDAFLEPRPENIERALRAIEPRHANEILVRLAAKKALLASGPDRLDRIQRMFEYLAAQKPIVAPGLQVELGELMASKRNGFPPFEIIEKPELIFDLGGRKTNRWNQGGLDQFGPCDRYQFSPKNLNIAVICQAHAKGRVEQFVDRLMNGMPDKVGFLRRFALDRPYG